MMFSPRNCVILHAKIVQLFGCTSKPPQNIEGFNVN